MGVLHVSWRAHWSGFYEEKVRITWPSIVVAPCPEFNLTLALEPVISAAQATGHKSHSVVGGISEVQLQGPEFLLLTGILSVLLCSCLGCW